MCTRPYESENMLCNKYINAIFLFSSIIICGLKSLLYIDRGCSFVLNIGFRKDKQNAR